mmetsp:Transcript_20802/g.29666  ORF Transcript_20802/g.29666 Transcript_20802/m.29666 type:complete len:119 (-) Transcript_20802:143-499(-)
MTYLRNQIDEQKYDILDLLPWIFRHIWMIFLRGPFVQVIFLSFFGSSLSEANPFAAMEILNLGFRARNGAAPKASQYTERDNTIANETWKHKNLADFIVEKVIVSMATRKTISSFLTF